MDRQRLVEAGLYDPSAPDAAQRLDLLAYLAGEGASVEDMVAAARDGNLTSLAADLRLRAGELTTEELAGRAGLALEQVEEAYRLLGVPDDRDDEASHDVREVRLLEVLELAQASLPPGLTEEVLRSIGSGLSMVAEAAVAAFVGSVEDELERTGDARHRAEVTTATGELAMELGDLLGPLFRRHLWAAIGRQRASMATGADRLATTLSVGFVDLVGFTSTTAAMEPHELLDFIRDFHRRTYDVVTAAGGRVVKYIGDEIMFAATSPVDGCRIALALLAAFGDAGSVPRAGLAHGRVVARHGDFYGPVVNLAARLADIAVPGEVLADAAGVEPALVGAAGVAVSPAGRRQLKGFAEPVAVVAVAPAG